ncbi:MAG: hypothetical protein IKT16_00750, partial [Desulfovibrio sp.]|nr:hypothetical protein [Desulfovibrio sp.]
MKLLSAAPFEPACSRGGRDAELAQLTAWLAAAHSLRAPVHALSVEGAPGSGVTTLLKRCLQGLPCVFLDLAPTFKGSALALGALLGQSVLPDPESLCEGLAELAARRGFAEPLILDGWDRLCLNQPALTQLLLARLKARLARQGKGASQALVFGCSGPGFPQGRGLPAGIERLQLKPFSFARLAGLFPDWSAGDLVWTLACAGARCSALALLPKAPSFRESFLQAPQERLWRQPWRAFERAGLSARLGIPLIEACAAAGAEGLQLALASSAGIRANPAELACCAEALVQAGLAELSGPGGTSGQAGPTGQSGQGGQALLRLRLADPLLLHGLRLAGGAEQARRGPFQGFAEALLGYPQGCLAPFWPRMVLEGFLRLAYRGSLPFPAQGPVVLAAGGTAGALPQGSFVLPERQGRRGLAVVPAVAAAPLDAGDAEAFARIWKAHCQAAGRDPSRDLVVFASPLAPEASFGEALLHSPAWQGMRACLAGPEELAGRRPV